MSVRVMGQCMYLEQRDELVAKWLIEYQDKGALFYRATGTGKTLLAAIVAQEKMKRGLSVVFVSVPDLLMDIRDSFGTGRTAEILRSVQRAPCLVLDDLGAERMSEWVGEQVFAILNYRSNHELQTIITSNYCESSFILITIVILEDQDIGTPVLF